MILDPAERGGVRELKSRRKMLILDLIHQEVIETQEELSERLRQANVAVTQATISRDIKELGLIKIPLPDGRYRYWSGDEGNISAPNDRLMRIFRDCVLSIVPSGNLIVITTMSATAEAVCEAIDSMHMPEIIGTMAGERTIFIAIRPPERTEEVATRLHDLLD